MNLGAMLHSTPSKNDSVKKNRLQVLHSTCSRILFLPPAALVPALAHTVIHLHLLLSRTRYQPSDQSFTPSLWQKTLAFDSLQRKNLQQHSVSPPL